MNLRDPSVTTPPSDESGRCECSRSNHRATASGLALSPRRRRLRTTLLILSAVAILGIAFGVYWMDRSRPDPYRPGQAVAGITSELARRLPPGAPFPKFIDVTGPAGLGEFRTFAGNRTSQLPEDMGPGVAWGDFNNNGFDDVFLVSAGGALGLPDAELEPSVLFENLGDGTFQQVMSFPELRMRGMGAAWGDYDNDGFLDLVVAGYKTLQLFRNEGGTGHFTRVELFPQTNAYWAGVSWGDFDRDGWLDLYVCGYVQYEEDSTDGDRVSMQLGTIVPFTLNPASYPAQENLLFRNLGDGTFTNVAVALGVSNPDGRSLAALWHDFDDDGWPDLYVANDVSDNVFYRNTGTGFEDLSHAAHVADYRSAMGLAAGDFDRDGDDDLFIGHWVGQENALFENFMADLRRSPEPAGLETDNHQESKRAATSHPLRFMDVADQKGLGQVALPYVSWGAEFADFDGDGWLDLIVANGNTLENLDSHPRQLRPQETFLFWNEQGRHFHNLAPLSPALSERHVARGLALADYDNDGAVDILLSFLGEGVQLLRNEMHTGNWIKIRLRSRTPAGEPIGFADGARAIAWINGVPLRRTVSSASYLSQSSRTLHFGLGKAPQIDRLEIRWASGSTNIHFALGAQTIHEVHEDDPNPMRWKPNGRHTSMTTSRSVPVKPSNHVAALDERQRILEFWKRQRAAMDAMMIEGDVPRAIEWFSSALELNPDHQDSRYYLAHCLMAQGDVSGALRQLEELTRINPRSHRGFQQWGVLRAISATTSEHLAAASRSLQQAHAINPEETGALLLLGEVALMQGNQAHAAPIFAAVCAANARAVGGWFLQGYLAWSQEDGNQARHFLELARDARGPEWQPKGTTAEGDVKQKQHVETSPLSRFWENWDGTSDPASAFAPLARRLDSLALLCDPLP